MHNKTPFGFGKKPQEESKWEVQVIGNFDTAQDYAECLAAHLNTGWQIQNSGVSNYLIQDWSDRERLVFNNAEDYWAILIRKKMNTEDIKKLKRGDLIDVKIEAVVTKVDEDGRCVYFLPSWLYNSSFSSDGSVAYSDEVFQPEDMDDIKNIAGEMNQ